MLKLYYAKHSCSSVALLTAKKLKIPIEVVNVDIMRGLLPDGAAYSSVTEKGYVPALRLANGDVITEVVAVCAYLSMHKGENTLFPLVGLGMIEQLEWFNYIATELHQNYAPLIHQAFGQKVNEEHVAHATAKLQMRYQYIEEKLVNQQYLVGGTLTSADFYLLVTLMWAGLTHFDLTNYPNLLKFKERMLIDDDVQTVFN